VKKNLDNPLETALGYRFSRPELLEIALAHKSFVNEHPGDCPEDNERLEFLGDAVLDLVVSDKIFNDYPLLKEGEMTRVRAEVVSEKSLSALARGIHLGEALSLGRGEEQTGGRAKESLLADALEAVFGAVFVDGGFAAAREVILHLTESSISIAVRRKSGLDNKTRLQEELQSRFGLMPDYVLLKTLGPDHARIYQVAVRFREEIIGRGEGRTKKQAEQRAAAEALEHFVT